MGNFLLGCLASLVVAAAFAGGGWWKARRELRLRYKRMVGDGYVGWGFIDDEAAELVRKPDPQSTARVEYTKRNLLRLHVAHGTRAWVGEVSMENEHFGVVIWRYTDTPPGREAFGFKRVMVSEQAGAVSLLLVGERPFGLEVLERTAGATVPRRN